MNSEELEIKKRIQTLLFPDGLLLDIKNRVYLTRKVNSVFGLSLELKGGSGDIKEKRQPISQLPSSRVEGTLKLSNRISSYLAKIDNLKHVDFGIK